MLGAQLYWVYAPVIDIGGDDILLMQGSRKIDAGLWRQLFAPQHIHFLPLFRLARLPFDLHFPAWSEYFHALVVAAHLAGAVFLYLLARRYLHSHWAALGTAFLFACSTVGEEALVWKAASPFVFSWAFLLLSLWCFAHAGNAWGAAGAGALLTAFGFFSGALFVLPGLFLGIWLLEPASQRRVLGSCLGVGLVGAVTWLVLVRPQAEMDHYWKFGSATAGPLTRLGWAVADTWQAYVWQFGLGLHAPDARYVLLLLLATSLLVLRRAIHWRWVLAVLGLTLLPLFVIMLIRKEAEVWKIGRYGYQSYTFWAVALGCLGDAVLWKLERWPHWRVGLLVLLLLPAGLYWNEHSAAAAQASARLRPEAQRTFWFGWDSFFRFASTRRTASAKPLGLPPVEVFPGLNLRVVFSLCHPGGLPGVVALEEGGLEEQREFWAEVAAAQAELPLFRQLGLRPR